MPCSRIFHLYGGSVVPGWSHCQCGSYIMALNEIDKYLTNSLMKEASIKVTNFCMR